MTELVNSRATSSPLHSLADEVDPDDFHVLLPSISSSSDSSTISIQNNLPNIIISDDRQVVQVQQIIAEIKASNWRSFFAAYYRENLVVKSGDVRARLVKRLKTTGGAIRVMQVVFSFTELAIMCTVMGLDPQMGSIWAWLIVALVVGVARALYQLLAPNSPKSCFNGDIFFAIMYALVCVTIGLMYYISPMSHDTKGIFVEALLFVGIGFGSVLAICYLIIAIAEMFCGYQVNNNDTPPCS